MKVIRMFLLAIIGLTQVACDNSMLYDGSVRELPDRWPDDVQTCGVVSNVLLGLGLLVTQDQLPFFPGGRGGCGYSAEDHAVVVLDGDDLRIGKAMGVDSDGSGAYYNYYNFQLSRNDAFFGEKPDPINGNTNQFYNPTWTYRSPATAIYPETWSFNRPIFDRPETINGLVWRHFMFWEYDSLSADPDAPPLSVTDPNGEAAAVTGGAPVVTVSHPEALILVGEVYEHVVDSDHKMIVYANYRREVTQDQHWLAARRALLRKLVDAVTITPLSEEQVETFRGKKVANDARRAVELRKAQD